MLLSDTDFMSNVKHYPGCQKDYFRNNRSILKCKRQHVRIIPMFLKRLPTVRKVVVGVDCLKSEVVLVCLE